MHVDVAYQQPDLTVSVAVFIFVSSGHGSRLLTERAEVVGGLTAAAGAMSNQRPHVRLPRWAGCAILEMHEPRPSVQLPQ